MRRETESRHDCLPVLNGYLVAVFGSEDRSALIELRVRSQERVEQRFHAVRHLAAVQREVSEEAKRADVYVGVLPRRRHGGARADLLPNGRVLWADLDSEEASRRLAEFPRPPSLIVESGTRGHRHAYWLLRRPTTRRAPPEGT